MPAFSARHPTIQVHVRECEPDGWGLLLARGEVDVVACREMPQPPAGFRFVPVLDDRLVVMCRPGHPLAGRKGVTWTRLAREQWLPAPVNSHARRVFDAQMAAIDARPRELRVVTRAPALTWAMLTASDVLTLATLGAMRQMVDTGALAIVELRTPLPFARLGLLMPLQGASLGVQRLADHLLAVAADLQSHAGKPGRRSHAGN